MAKSVEGVYHDGKIELAEPLEGAEGSRVIVTLVSASASPSTNPPVNPPVNPASANDLRERGIDEAQAADLRHRLTAFTEDWDRAEMMAYDELPPR